MTAPLRRYPPTPTVSEERRRVMAPAVDWALTLHDAPKRCYVMSLLFAIAGRQPLSTARVPQALDGMDAAKVREELFGKFPALAGVQ